MKTLISRLRARPVTSVIALVALLLAAGFGITAWAMDDSIDTNDVVNQAGGYSLQVPDDWQTTQQARTTTVTSPGKDAVLRVGAGQAGPLEQVAALFFQQVGRQYRDVQLLGIQAEDVGAKPALVYAGIGTNSKNVRVRFLAITVANKPANYAIGVFTSDGSDAERVLPRVNTVVDTFRPLDKR
ncbi:MAG: hypothetical protein ACRDT0_06505 [Pseudonocardiaceae bacterium]